MRGQLIVVEGLDRAGKSTQCSKLASRLRATGREVLELKFPDRSTPTGQIINEYLTSDSELSDEAIHLLFSANRWEQVPRMRAALERGALLVVDRYSYSGIAFSAAKGLDFEWCRAPDVGLPVPDLVIFLDISSDAAAKRGGYGRERYESEQLQARVREQFLKLKDRSWAWIDAGQPLHEVEAAVWSRVNTITAHNSQL